MIEKLASKIAGSWEKSNAITAEKKEIYVYGLDIVISSLGITMLVAIISLAFGNILYALFYYACFMPIRGYCGGYHAKTRWGCALTQCAAFSAVAAASLYLVNVIPWPVILAIFACALTLAWRLAPVDHPANPIDSDKRSKLKRNGLITLTLILLAIFVLLYFGLAVCANIMVLATVVAITSMLFAQYGIPGEKNEAR